jgi:hypothetical protein
MPLASTAITSPWRITGTSSGISKRGSWWRLPITEALVATTRRSSSTARSGSAFSPNGMLVRKTTLPSGRNRAMVEPTFSVARRAAS